MADPTPSRDNLSPFFYAPDDLAASPADAPHILIVGADNATVLAHHLSGAWPGATADLLPFAVPGALPPPPRPMADYDCRIVLLPLRTIVPEVSFFGLSWHDLDGYRRCLAESMHVLRTMLDECLHPTADGIPTFVADFLVPQANTVGRLLPRNDIRNLAAYVRELNTAVADHVAAHDHCYMLGIDDIAARIGRRFLQDDSLHVGSNGSCLTEWNHFYDADRPYPPPPLGEVQELRIDDFFQAIWAEIAAMMGTLAARDRVGLVICDADTMLWRTPTAEQGIEHAILTEGWPNGLIEALDMLRRRGIALALVSQEGEDAIRSAWPATIGDRLPLDSFAAIRSSHDPAATNVGEVLRDTGRRRRETLFLSRDPAAREAVRSACPGIRVLGDDPYAIRRVLLWAPETQVALMPETASGGGLAHPAPPRAQWLALLDIVLTRHRIEAIDHPKFAAALDLLNRANLFNTTGRRWQRHELAALFKSGGRIEAFSLRDRFADHGLAGLALIDGAVIEQMVLRGSALGLDAEIAFVHAVTAGPSQNRPTLAKAKPTGANVFSRDLYRRCGWTKVGESWQIGKGVLPPPPHVTVVDAIMEPA